MGNDGMYLIISNDLPNYPNCGDYWKMIEDGIYLTILIKLPNYSNWGDYVVDNRKWWYALDHF